jgi:hypothetical protein
MKLITVLVLVTVFVVLSNSCKNDETPVSNAPQEFVMKIDSVKLEKNISRNDTLRARLWGKIGNTSCYSFARYEATRDSFQATIKAFGKVVSSSSCAAANVELRGAIYRVYPIYPGKFTFYVQQPDGSTLRDTTLVL